MYREQPGNPRHSALPASAHEKRKAKHREGRTDSPPISALKGALIGLLLTLFLSAVLLPILSAILSAQPDPNPLILPAGLLLSLFCAIFCGFISEKVSGASFPLVGLFSGIAYTLFFWLISLPVATGTLTEALSPLLILLLRAVQLCLCLLGAYLAAKRPISARKAGRRRHPR